MLAFDDHYSQGAPKLPRIDDRWTGTLMNPNVGKVGIDHHGETDLSRMGLTRRDNEENKKALL